MLYANLMEETTCRPVDYFCLEKGAAKRSDNFPRRRTLVGKTDIPFPFVSSYGLGVGSLR